MNTINEQKLATLVDKVFEDGDYEANFSDVSEADWDILLWDKDQMKDAIKNGILYGIVEFVNFLWHDASEEPEDHTDIVYIDEKGDVWREYDYYADNYDDAFHKGWLSFVNNGVLRVIKWCYLSDILPKEGGEK